MINKDNILPDFWNAISLHYEKECYEDTLKDACFYLIDLIQNKSENFDLDGEKLINNVFSEKNPKLLINKNQTISEQDEQRGFGYIIRGLICSIRNPLSHSKDIKYKKEEVDSILLFINNYILSKIDDTKEFGYVDNWFDFIFIENSNDSVRYSNKILENISKKDKIDLAKEIIENLNLIKEGKYKYLINKLYDGLTTKSKNEICILLNRNLIKVNDDHYLRMFFNHFDKSIWSKLDDLITARIEEMVFKSIQSGRIVFSDFEMKEILIEGASLSTWVSDWIDVFSNKDEIISCLFNKLNYEETGKYTLHYFTNILYDKELIMKYKDNIISGLKNGKISYKKLLDYIFIFEDDPDYDVFKKYYNDFKEIKEAEDELPF